MEKEFVIISLFIGKFIILIKDLNLMIPYPAKVEFKKGKFVLNSETTINCSHEVTPVAEYLKEVIANATGYNLTLNTRKRKNNLISFILKETKKLHKDFRKRLERFSERLKIMGVKYASLEDVDPKLIKRFWKLRFALKWPEI